MKDAPDDHNPSAFDPASPPKDETLGFALGFVGVVIFSGTLPATRLALTAFDPVFITVGRAAIAGLLSLVTLLALKRRLPERSAFLALISGSLLLVGGFPLFSSLALQTAEASHGAVVLAVLPLATAAAGAIIGRERPTAIFWLFALLGSAAVFAFVLTGSRGEWRAADAFFLASALCAAFGYAFSGGLAKSMPGWEVICWQLVIALPVTLVMALLLRPDLSLAAIPAKALSGFAYVSLFSMFLGFFAWNAGLAAGGVAKVGQLLLLQVFITLIFSALILGERLELRTLAFAALVVAIVALGRRASRPSR